jgi:hypothetical protein
MTAAGGAERSAATGPGDLRLEPLELWLQPEPGPLLPQVRAALLAHGHPLRWAITAADTVRGLRIEGVVVAGTAGP